MYQLILNENNVTNVVAICAWCDVSKTTTKKYISKGWSTTHGICQKHKEEFLKNVKKRYENNKFNYTSNGDDWMSIIRGDEP